MAISKGNKYAGMELDWLKERAEEWKKYCDDRPLDALKDRTDIKGRVVSKIEDQIKCIRETLKDYALLLEAIIKLSEKEEMKKTLTRGDANLTPLEEGQI